MKQLICFILLTALFACGESVTPAAEKTDSTTNDTITSKSIATDTLATVDRHTGLKDFKEYKLTDTIVADFNGDNQPDKAYIESTGNMKRLYILDGNFSKPTLVGNDKSFDGNADNLDWVDFWGLTRDSVSSENIVKDGKLVGSRDIKLKNPSIVLMRAEVGGGLVNFRKGKFVWIHQAD